MMKIKQIKTPQEKFDQRWNKPLSVERSVHSKVCRRKSWTDGITFKQLKQQVEEELKKDYTDCRVYNAISQINRYGKGLGVYIMSKCSLFNGKSEWRYFTPEDVLDIRDERRNLENRKGMIDLKENNLEYHERITIPQAKQIEQLRIAQQ